MFCPQWIFDICAVRVAGEFISSELTLEAYSKKYSEGLNSLYNKQEITPEFICGVAQTILEFLSEIEAGEQAFELISNFTYFRLHFESLNQPRKMKPLFGNIEDGAKVNEIKPDLSLKTFRAFVFGLRSNTTPIPPADWKLENDEHLVKIKEIINKQVSILDSL